MDRRLSRRKLATAIGALVLAVPALSACGFNYATEREYTPGNGTNYQHGVVDVLNAVIVAGEDGSGTFIASLSNNAPTSRSRSTRSASARTPPSRSPRST